MRPNECFPAGLLRFLEGKGPHLTGIPIMSAAVHCAGVWNARGPPLPHLPKEENESTYLTELSQRQNCLIILNMAPGM